MMLNENEFLEKLERAMNSLGLTENGAVTNSSTKSRLLDFFYMGAALRSRGDGEIIRLFQNAIEEDLELAVRILFYIRDVREGQGERRTFRVCIKWLATHMPDIFPSNFSEIICEYGRFDDLYEFVDTELESKMFLFIKNKLRADWACKEPSLLAKWLKSENASSKQTRQLAIKTRKAIGLRPKSYRKVLSELRRRIGVVERKISNKQWKSIKYDKIPSKAGLIYKDAFIRHDEARYMEFIADVESKKKKVNVKTLYPYEIVRKCFETYGISEITARSLDAMWTSLPNYFKGDFDNSIVVADTSGSMEGLPIAVSVSLAIYAAERNAGAFHNKFITFSRRPCLQTIVGNNIVEKIKSLCSTDWEMNTDIEAVFDLILSTAIRCNSIQEDIPSTIYIVSDMEFDSAAKFNDMTYGLNEALFETIAKKYEQARYKMPYLVFWNVDARNDQSPVTMHDSGVKLVSGCSPKIFEQTLKYPTLDSHEFMMQILNSDRYSQIKWGKA